MIKTKLKSIVIVSAIFLVVLIPAVAFAQSDSSFFGPLVPCGTEATDNVPCDFSHLIQGIQNIINFAVAISVPIAAIGFAYAGFLYITAAGSEGQLKKANSIFKYIGVGFIIVLGAWLIVSTITGALLDPGFDVPIGL